MVLKSFAKINLALKVLNRRADGFHNIETLFASVSLSDKITVKKSDTLSVECDDPSIPSGPENLAYKAASALQQGCGTKQGAAIALKKAIPAGAGLAGGSGNAAVVVKGCLKLWKKKISKQKLDSLLVSLGSDVPYCYYGGTALAKGRGEQLTQLAHFPAYFVVLVNPGIHVSTPFAYKALKRGLTATEEKVNLLSRYKSFLSGKLLLSELLENDFEQAVFKEHKAIRTIKEQLLAEGADGALMSGSGSTVFGLFKKRADAKRAAEVSRSRGLKTFEAKILTGTNPHSL